MWLLRPKYIWRAPLSDSCPGEAAVTNAQWGIAPRAPVQEQVGVAVRLELFACMINGRQHGANQRRVHDGQRTKMVRGY